MGNLKRTLAFAITAGCALMATGCADDNLAKGLLAVGGAAGGAYIGHKVAPQSGITGPIVGAAAGGGLGYLLGGAIGKSK